jgi:RNA polymerase sigma factor (sigma-70 family)
VGPNAGPGVRAGDRGVLKPVVTAIQPEVADEHLVLAAQAGDTEAFAALFRRYRPEICRYAIRTLDDEVRAEDVVQETFLSALRSIGNLDHPTGFKPWLYRIAHNACIDQVRRRARAMEVSFEADQLPPNEEIRLFRQAPSSYTALTQKEDVEHLRQALVGLPPAQAEILLLRELEGLSYEEIAAHLQISQSAVESMLFRARRSLRDEFGEIATGERCRAMRAAMAKVAEGVGGRRDRRALTRHLRECITCRRDGLIMGLGSQLDLERRSRVRARLARLGALLPLPQLLNRRSEATTQASASGGTSVAGHAHVTIAQLGATAGHTVEHAATAIQKAAAVVAAAAVVGGGGVVANGTRTDPAPLSPVARQAATQGVRVAAPRAAPTAFSRVLVVPLAPVSAQIPPPVLSVVSVADANPPAETAATEAVEEPAAETVPAPALTEPEPATPAEPLEEAPADSSASGADGEPGGDEGSSFDSSGSTEPSVEEPPVSPPADTGGSDPPLELLPAPDPIPSLPPTADPVLELRTDPAQVPPDCQVAPGQPACTATI